MYETQCLWPNGPPIIMFANWISQYYGKAIIIPPVYFIQYHKNICGLLTLFITHTKSHSHSHKAYYVAGRRLHVYSTGK